MKVKEGDILVCTDKDCTVQLTVTQVCDSDSCGVECEVDAMCHGKPMELSKEG